MKKSFSLSALFFLGFFIAEVKAQDKAVCDSVHTFAENPAEYPGGMKGFYDFLKDFRYEEVTADDPVTGKFTIRFILDEKGEPHNIHVTPETDPGIALQDFLVNMKNWTPAKVKEEAVCIEMKIPAYVRFK